MNFKLYFHLGVTVDYLQYLINETKHSLVFEYKDLLHPIFRSELPKGSIPDSSKLIELSKLKFKEINEEIKKIEQWAKMTPKPVVLSTLNLNQFKKSISKLLLINLSRLTNYELINNASNFQSRIDSFFIELEMKLKEIEEVFYEYKLFSEEIHNSKYSWLAFRLENLFFMKYHDMAATLLGKNIEQVIDGFIMKHRGEFDKYLNERSKGNGKKKKEKGDPDSFFTKSEFIKKRRMITINEFYLINKLWQDRNLGAHETEDEMLKDLDQDAESILKLGTRILLKISDKLK